MSVLLRGSFGLLARALTEGKWSQLFPLGKWHGPNFQQLGGSLDLTPEMMSEMVANWKASGSPALPVYFHHPPPRNKVPPEKHKDVYRAAGWIEDLRQTEAGLEAAIKWSTEGQQAVDSDAYRFISPEWQPRDMDRRTGSLRGWTVTGAALTDDPFFHTMPPVAASASAESTDSNPPHRSNTMNEEQLKLRASLGLASTATDAEVLAAQTKQAEELVTLRAAASKPAPDLKSEIAAAVALHVEPLKASLAKEQEARVKLEAEALSLKVDGLIATAKQGDGKQGRAIVDEKVRPVLLKLVASEKTTDEGLKAAKDFLEAIPLTVPVVATGTPGSATGPLTKESAHKLIAARAEELRAKGDPTPTITAMRELPNETLIAEGRRTTSQN
jgi:phage I-like protein